MNRRLGYGRSLLQLPGLCPLVDPVKTISNQPSLSKSAPRTGPTGHPRQHNAGLAKSSVTIIVIDSSYKIRAISPSQQQVQLAIVIIVTPCNRAIEYPGQTALNLDKLPHDQEKRSVEVAPS